MIKLKLLLGQWLAKLTRKLKNNFYIYLASLFTILVLLDASVFHVGLNMRDKAFDFMVKHRVIQAKADPQIIIVDINEASLAAFSKEYGRWPWPRQVLGEFVENIQAQKPKAIVFDIVFSDADIYNPDSDAYFNDVIGASENVFFPILRLDPSQDKLSQLKYAQIPGIKPYPDHNQNATVAAILPFFEGAQKANRLGTHNVYPDNDGIVREYRIYQPNEGWHLPSLPEVVGKYAGGSLVNVPQNMLMNWRGKPFSYQYVTFSDVFTDLTSQHKKRSQSEFTDKIVIIGSTAAGLFDIKPTAMDKQFPGVEVLATAIDNVKHGDYLKVWRGKTPYIILSLLLIWVTTLAFYFKVDRDKFNSIFTGSQVGLLALSYIGINVSNTYLDLTGPILWAVALFGIAKIYALATDRALQRWLTFGVQANADHTCVLMLAASIESDEPLGDVVMKKLKRKLELASTTPSTVEVLLGTQTGIWGLFGDMVIVSWLYSDEKPEYKTTAQQDAQRVMDSLPAHIEALGLPKQTLIRYASHEGKLLQSNTPANSQNLGAQWRTLFAQLIIQLEHGDRAETKDIA
jgi:CHASE2 domain-containing sensor protein